MDLNGVELMSFYFLFFLSLPCRRLLKNPTVKMWTSAPWEELLAGRASAAAKPHSCSLSPFSLCPCQIFGHEKIKKKHNCKLLPD